MIPDASTFAIDAGTAVLSVASLATAPEVRSGFEMLVHAVDGIALEAERIAEAHRFPVRLEAGAERA